MDKKIDPKNNASNMQNEIKTLVAQIINMIKNQGSSGKQLNHNQKGK
ncbi:hypothetical protein [Campylobacter armoricus]|nr:hypothetical protein [Campylobacter armoricus]